MTGHHQQVSADLGAAVGGSGMDRGFLGGEPVRPIRRQILVYFIRGNFMVALNTILPASILKDCRTQNIYLDENTGVR